MGFETYIKNQELRNNECGHFAAEYLRLISSPEEFPRISAIESDTLLGFYNHVPIRFRSTVYIMDALIKLWYEYLEYKHIGFKFNQPQIGYVYFFKVKGQNAFKIGKTKKNPLVRMAQVETNEKVELEVFNWIKIKHYSIIEAKLKQAFKKFQIQREWYKFKYVGVSKDGEEYCGELKEAIYIYSHTDEDRVLFNDKNI